MSTDDGGGGSLKDTALDAAEAARQEAARLASGAADRARRVANDAAAQAKALAEQVVEQVTRLVEQTTGEVREAVERRGGQAAGGLRGFSDELRSLAGPEGGEGLRQYVDDAQQQVAELAERLDRDGAQGFVQDLTRLAKKRPAVFLLAVASAGVALERTLRRGGSRGAGEDVVALGADGEAAAEALPPPTGPVAADVPPPTGAVAADVPTITAPVDGDAPGASGPVPADESSAAQTTDAVPPSTTLTGEGGRLDPA